MIKCNRQYSNFVHFWLRQATSQTEIIICIVLISSPSPSSWRGSGVTAALTSGLLYNSRNAVKFCPEKKTMTSPDQSVISVEGGESILQADWEVTRFCILISSNICLPQLTSIFLLFPLAMASLDLVFWMPLIDQKHFKTSLCFIEEDFHQVE